MGREGWWVTVHGVARVRHDLATKTNQQWCSDNPEILQPRSCVQEIAPEEPHRHLHLN